MEQGTEEWKLARLGKVTASRVSAARAKKGTATRADYIADIITERLTGSPDVWQILRLSFRSTTRQRITLSGSPPAGISGSTYATIALPHHKV